jgi:hypothetical protein
MSKDMAMEDVHSIGLAAMEAIQIGLREFGITLTPEQEDKIYTPMCDELEKVAGYPDYRSHN